MSKRFNEKYHGYSKHTDRYERDREAAIKQDLAAANARQQKWEARVESNKYKLPNSNDKAHLEEGRKVSPEKEYQPQIAPNKLVFTGHTQYGKAMQYYDGNCMPRCIIYEQDLQAQLTIGVRTLQGQHSVMITKYRSLLLPDKILPSVESADFTFTLSQLNGTRVKAEVAAPLLVNYDENGKLIKLSIPGTVNIPGFNDTLPVITMYHGAPYTVPITAGTFKFLANKVRENSGTVEIGQTDQGGVVEYILNSIAPLNIVHHPSVSTPLMGDGHHNSFVNDKCCAVM